MNLIVARGANGEIGAGNKLLWNLPGELAHFKKLTTFNTVVMGRKTWESIGEKPLPNRLNIVITRSPESKFHKQQENVKFCTYDDFIRATSMDNFIYGDIFIIGGSEIYKLFDQNIDVMYITEVEHTFPHADSYFMGLDGKWDISLLKTSQENGLEYRICKYVRRK